ncbi:Ribosomal protein S24/S35, mitochondrial, conserved domain, partial [Dillenia turbinata]
MDVEFKEKIEKYFKGDEEALPDIFEAILKRKLPLDDVKDKEFESDFDELYETDEEIDDLYNARQIVERRMEATEKGFPKDTKECEAILEDMLSWDKLLPDEIKQKVEAKFNELGDMCERGELEPEEAYRLFKEYEDQMVLECAEIMEAEGPPQFDEMSVPEKKDKDDPPGEGPILRWKTRVVFAPGGDAWHPKNRKVKLSVTVKELGLSKHQFRRLRELVGKRYNPGKDELTITSERFEHREENRKDCLRTLFNLIEEAGKANKMVEEARTSYVKDRLRANPDFMERLHAKTIRLQASKPAP